LAGAGLLGGGIIGVSALVSADDEPSFDQATTELPAADLTATAEPSGEPSGDSSDEPVLDGQITIDDGDGDPFVLDLGELSQLDADQLQQLQECMGLPTWNGDGTGDITFGEGDLPFGDLDLQELFDQFFSEDGPLADLDLGQLDLSQLDLGDLDLGDLDLGDLDLESVDPSETGVDGLPGDGTVTVIGSDGVTIVDLGDGDGSATITRDGETGEITVETDGTATTQTLDELIAPFLDQLGQLDLGDLDLGDLDLGQLDLGQLDLGQLDLGGMFDGEQLQRCLDELG
jgi:hypothetical protein